MRLHLYKFPMKYVIWCVLAHLLPPPVLLLQAVSSLSLWEWEWFLLFCFFFVTAIWEINKCFCCLFLFSPPAHGFWGAMRSLNHNDNITAGMMTRGSYCENSLNKLLCPLFLLSGYECSYDLSFWYLGWVFLQCKLPRNISVFAGCCFFL